MIYKAGASGGLCWKHFPGDSDKLYVCTAALDWYFSLSLLKRIPVLCRHGVGLPRCNK